MCWLCHISYSSNFRLYKRVFDFLTNLHVAAVHMHASDHTALSGHIRPVDHLLCIVEVQCHCIIQTLKQRWVQY